MFHSHRAKKNNQQGMSLLEVMVSFLIFTLVFIALTQSFPLSISINKTAENATKASYLAQSQLESLAALNYDSINIGTIEPKHRLSNDTTNYLYYFQRQTMVSYVDGNLTASGTETDLKKITVTIYYTNASSKTEKIYDTSTLITAAQH